jgi:hypothetical protein
MRSGIGVQIRHLDLQISCLSYGKIFIADYRPSFGHHHHCTLASLNNFSSFASASVLFDGVRSRSMKDNEQGAKIEASRRSRYGRPRFTYSSRNSFYSTRGRSDPRELHRELEIIRRSRLSESRDLRQYQQEHRNQNTTRSLQTLDQQVPATAIENSSERDIPRTLDPARDQPVHQVTQADYPDHNPPPV